MRALVVRLKNAHGPAIAILDRELASRAYDRVIGLGASDGLLSAALAERLELEDTTSRRPIAVADGRRVYVAPDGAPTESARGLSPGDVVLVDGARPVVDIVDAVDVVSPGAAGGSPGDPRVRFARVTLHGNEAQIELAARPFDLRHLAHVSPLLFRRWLETPEDAMQVGPDARGADAALALIGSRLGAVYHAASGPWPEDEIAHVHDIRVATRRLRAALAIARPILGPAHADRARAKLEAFGEILGARRAADVNLERMDELRDAAPDDDERAVVLRIEALVSARRRRSRARLLAEYPADRLARHGIALLSAAMSAPDGAPISVGMELELERRVARVKARLTTMSVPADDAGHHELRIALKRLRYTCEIIGPVMPERVSSHAAQELKTLQDALGKLHDEVELIGLVDSRRVRRDAPAAGIDAIVGRLSATREALFREAKEKVEASGAGLVEALGG